MSSASLLLLLCVLLLAAVGPFAAAARREPTMAATGDEADGAAQAKLAWTETAPAEGLNDKVTTRKEERRGSDHFRSRKFSSNAKNPFDGRVPFTADYHNVRRHPPSHN